MMYCREGSVDWIKLIFHFDIYLVFVFHTRCAIITH